MKKILIGILDNDMFEFFIKETETQEKIVNKELAEFKDNRVKITIENW